MSPSRPPYYLRVGMKPAGIPDSVGNPGSGPLEGQMYRNLGTLARKALYFKRPAQQRHPFHHSQQAEGIASLQRLFDLETDSIILYAKFNRVIGRTQVDVYSGCGRMFSDIVKTLLHKAI